MKITIDFLSGRKRSLLRIILGVLLLAMSVIWVVSKTGKGYVLRVFDWLLIFCFIVNGLINITEGFGISRRVFYPGSDLYVGLRMKKNRPAIFYDGK